MAMAASVSATRVEAYIVVGKWGEGGGGGFEGDEEEEDDVRGVDEEENSGVAEAAARTFIYARRGARLGGRVLLFGRSEGGSIGWG